jgi:hypothetical protein
MDPILEKEEEDISQKFVSFTGHIAIMGLGMELE